MLCKKNLAEEKYYGKKNQSEPTQPEESTTWSAVKTAANVAKNAAMLGGSVYASSMGLPYAVGFQLARAGM